MGDLIDRDVALSKFDENDANSCYMPADICRILKNIPAADAAKESDDESKSAYERTCAVLGAWKRDTANYQAVATGEIAKNLAKLADILSKGLGVWL